ncbi:MAG: efflux RND transporter permease subunit, partial [Flexibacteraceae bacterium]
MIKDKQATSLPDGLTVTITGDQSDETRVTLNDLINTVILGFVFVVIVLMFFMGTTNAIFVGLSVPLSSLVAFLILPGFDYTLNMIVTFSFLLALGIVVDDAIVVIENTHRIFHLHPEKGIIKSAKEAAGEVFIPVLSGTLTTIAPFVPLLFWPGIIGEFMEYLPVTLIITLFASLFVAFIMNPVFAVSFMKTAEEEKAIKNSGIRQHLWPVAIIGILILIGYGMNVGVGNFFVIFLGLYFLNHYVLTPVIEGFQNSFLPALKNGYRSLLRHVIKGNRPILYVFGCIVLLVGIFYAYGKSNPRVELFPSGDPNFVYVYNQMPIGTDARVTDSVTKIMEQRVFEVIGKDNKAVKSVISNVGLGAGTADNPDRVVT